MKSKLPEGYLTQGEAADYLGCDTRTIRRLVRLGEIESYRFLINRRFRFYQKTDLDVIRLLIPGQEK